MNNRTNKNFFVICTPLSNFISNIANFCLHESYLRSKSDSKKILVPFDSLEIILTA